jgi:glycerophosphoryl diester phosphodiesterase
MSSPPLHERRLYGHRGGGALPENTLPAFQQALRDGATALEMDVHLTRDGRVVVCHDPDGRRVAGVPRAIADCTFEEIRTWNLGPLPDLSTARVVAFEEVLAAFPGTRLNVDLKPPDLRIVDAVIALVRRLGAESNVTLASFHDANIRGVLASDYRGEVGLGPREVLQLRLAPWSRRRTDRDRSRAVQIPRAAYGLRLDSERFIARCHALGFRVDYWVVNEPEGARLLLQRGADGIVTDAPARVAPAMAPGPRAASAG